MTPATKDWFVTARTLAIGAAGAGVFTLIGFPVAVLTGPAAAVSVAALAGLRCVIPDALRDALLLTLGIGIGSTVTPEVVQTALLWPLSLAVLTAAVLAIFFIARAALERGFGYDRMTAVLAATPGHLSFVLGLSTTLGANVPQVALVQTVRVLLLTLCVPVLISAWGIEGTPPTGPAPVMAFGHLAILVPLSLIFGLVLKRLTVPAPLLLAAMGVSALTNGSALTTGTPPPWLTVAAFVGMGAMIGTRFSGLDRRGFGVAFLAGLVTTLIACAVAAVFAALAASVVGLPPAALLLAFAPGGVEVMAAIAIETGLEPAFVAAHHIFRLLALSIMLPVLIRLSQSRAR